MSKTLIVFLLSTLASIAFSYPQASSAVEAPILKAVMQINNENFNIVMRGLRNAQDIADVAKTEGRQLDLKLVIFGPAVDLFSTGADSLLRSYFKTLAERSDIHFFVDGRRLKKLHKNLKNLLPHFEDVPSGAYEVLKLESEGYLYIKP